MHLSSLHFYFAFGLLDDGTDVEGLLPEDDIPTPSGTEGGSPDSEESDEFWKSFISPSTTEKSVKANNGYIPQKQQESQVMKDDSEDSEEDKSEPKPSKSVKRNKWKPEEVKKLIDMRGELNERFQAVKGRMILWEEISQKLLADGINRTPGQCKSLWTSLMQKHEVCFISFQPKTPNLVVLSKSYLCFWSIIFVDGN